MSLQEKVALVTGSGRGIGRAIAERYAARGARVVVNYANNSALAEDAVAKIVSSGGKAIAVQADVARVDDIKHLFDTVLDTYGRLDIVVANAGIELVAQSVIDFTEADFDRLFAVNAKGAFFTLQQAARHVADNGRIIYIGTSNTAFPLPGRALYGGSKIAAQFLVQVLAKELGHRGVAVNSILPTAIEGAGVFTDGVRSEVREFVKSFRPMQRMGTVEDVADAAEYLAGDLSGFVSGQHLMVSGGGPA
ncbi:SDR family oxidoreductase [Mesorhizobium sp. M0976]|uniref:SDR family oxidoreductase n=1 Tax=unclassified Mesorhizobium TaxID=325217 RepID=UPI00333BD799